MFIFACENVGIHMSVYVLVHVLAYVCRTKSFNVSKSKNIVRILRSFKVSILITLHLECESAGISSFFVYVCDLKGVCVHVCVCVCVYVHARVCVCVCVCIVFTHFNFFQVEHPSSAMKNAWKKVISSQRKRAVMACFRMIPLHGTPR